MEENNDYSIKKLVERYAQLNEELGNFSGEELRKTPETFEYFSIGWGSATIATKLGILENDLGYTPENWVLENSLEMLTHCEAVFEIGKMIKDWDTTYPYHRLVHGELNSEFPWIVIDKGIIDYKDKYGPVRTLAKIRKMKSTMQDIREEKMVSKKSIKIAHEFFGDLSDKCLSYCNSNPVY